MKYKRITDMIGNTPVLEIPSSVHGLENIDLYAKLEMMNPFGSVKDRIAWGLVQDDIEGIQERGQTIYENSSGNTAKALQVIASMYGVKTKLITYLAKVDGVKDIVRMLGAEIEEAFLLFEELRVLGALGLAPRRDLVEPAGAGVVEVEGLDGGCGGRRTDGPTEGLHPRQRVLDVAVVLVEVVLGARADPDLDLDGALAARRGDLQVLEARHLGLGRLGRGGFGVDRRRLGFGSRLGWWLDGGPGPLRALSLLEERLDLTVLAAEFRPTLGGRIEQRFE